METADPIPALIAQIAAAFTNDPRLPRGALVQRGSWETENLLRNLARVKDAPTDAFIEWHADSLPVFTAKGFRHVIPYYLRYSLLHPESTATEFLIFHLSPEEPEAPYWRDRRNVLSPRQKEAICAFIRHLQVQLAGHHYDVYFARALVIWDCV